MRDPTEGISTIVCCCAAARFDLVSMKPCGKICLQRMCLLRTNDSKNTVQLKPLAAFIPFALSYKQFVSSSYPWVKTIKKHICSVADMFLNFAEFIVKPIFYNGGSL